MLKRSPGIVSLIIVGMLALLALGGGTVLVDSQNSLADSPTHSLQLKLREAKLKAAEQDNLAQANLYSDFAKQDLDTLNNALQDTDLDESGITQEMNEINNDLQNATQKITDAKDQKQDISGAVSNLQHNLDRQQDLLAAFLDKVPPNQRDSLLQNINTSRQNLLAAINQLTGQNDNSLDNPQNQALPNQLNNSF